MVWKEGCASKSNQTSQKKKRRAQNKEQHWPDIGTGRAKGRRCPWAGLLTGSEHPLTCARHWLASTKKVSDFPTGYLFRQMENHWFQPETSDSSMHICEQREEELPLLQCGCFRLHAAARQANSHFFSLSPGARHRIFCLTHQTKYRATVYHHKHDRLLLNEGCSP